MKSMPVLMVRIYITESSGLLKNIVNYLKNQANIRGVSVFRAISGFGETGNHTTSLLDLSLDLPLVIEFFDQQEKVEVALLALGKMVKPEHIVTWQANANV